MYDTQVMANLMGEGLDVRKPDVGPPSAHRRRTGASLMEQTDEVSTKRVRPFSGMYTPYSFFIVGITDLGAHKIQ